MSSDTPRNTLYTIHPYASAPEMPRERLDMTRCVSYARGKSEDECVAEFKAKYHIEPQFVLSRKDYGFTLGMIPANWNEDDESGEVENSSRGAGGV